MSDIQNKIDNINSLFNNMISNYETNYVNYNKNLTLSMPTVMPIPTGKSVTGSSVKDQNEEQLQNYRYAANNLLEQVRSQVSSNSKTISKINANITPVQKKYLSVLERGNNFDSTKSAAGASLDDYNELYKTTFFSILMYLVGSASILYLMFKPKLQSV
jgi:hypothetical protein